MFFFEGETHFFYFFEDSEIVILKIFVHPQKFSTESRLKHKISKENPILDGNNANFSPAAR